MATPGWTRPESPFHAGELAIQARLGKQHQMDKQGRRVIREFLPDQHRQFFAQLPYVIVGTIDAIGQPWASILVGNPGFLSSPSVGEASPQETRILQVTAQPLFGGYSETSCRFQSTSCPFNSRIAVVRFSYARCAAANAGTRW
jgi:hypothetical protein